MSVQRCSPGSKIQPSRVHLFVHSHPCSLKSKAAFSCLQIPYYLCSHILLELEGEDLAAAGWRCLVLTTLGARAQTVTFLCAWRYWFGGSSVFSPGFNSSRSFPRGEQYHLNRGLGLWKDSAHKLWWFNREVCFIFISHTGTRPFGVYGNLSSCFFFH